MAKHYISLQGEVFLAPIVNGVAGAMRSIGNVPSLELTIDADILEHQESMTGQRATDFTLVQKTSVSFKGKLEQVDAENLKLILSGTGFDNVGKTVTDENIGTVTAGQEIKLGGLNVSQVTFNDGTGQVIDASKYTVDAPYGTVTFKESITGAVKANYTVGKTSGVTIASDFSQTYQLFFKGIDTVTNDRVAVTLWKVKKSPKTTFGLIHEKLGDYDLEGQALADTTKTADASLGLYGNIAIIPAA